MRVESPLKSSPPSSGACPDRALSRAAGLQAAAARFLERFGLGERWGFFDSTRQVEYGPGAGHLKRLMREADLLVNLGGVHGVLAERRGDRPAIYIDFDPIYTQIRLANGDRDL